MTDPFLSDFLAAGVEADEVPELAALNTARPLLDAFITLFRGTEAEVLMRLLVLREIGREADVPRWSPDALRARFTYLDASGNIIRDPHEHTQKIRGVRVQLTAVPDPSHAHLGIGNRTLSTMVWCRNTEKEKSQ